MASSSACNCSTQSSVGAQFKHLILRTGKQAAIAITVNAVFMYLLGEEDLIPGVINGGATALSLNLTNKVVYCVWPKEASNLIKTVETSKSSESKKTSKETFHEMACLALVILTSCIMIPKAYEFFDYHPKMRNLLLKV